MPFHVMFVENGRTGRALQVRPMYLNENTNDMNLITATRQHPYKPKRICLFTEYCEFVIGITRSDYLEAVQKDALLPFVCQPCRLSAVVSVARDSTHEGHVCKLL